MSFGLNWLAPIHICATDRWNGCEHLFTMNLFSIVNSGYPQTIWHAKLYHPIISPCKWKLVGRTSVDRSAVFSIMLFVVEQTCRALGALLFRSKCHLSAAR